MTKQGKKLASIQIRDEAGNNGNFIKLEAFSKGISLLLTSGLTIYLARRSQYFAALISACLTLAAATCDRLRKIRLNRDGFQGEWQALSKRERAGP